MDLMRKYEEERENPEVFLKKKEREEKTIRREFSRRNLCNDIYTHWFVLLCQSNQILFKTNHFHEIVQLIWMWFLFALNNEMIQMKFYTFDSILIPNCQSQTPTFFIHFYLNYYLLVKGLWIVFFFLCENYFEYLVLKFKFKHRLYNLRNTYFIWQ